ncbi:hypothetical protein ACLOJK_018027 [Asimina triloba]
MYHFQRSRLRTALGHLYHVALAKEHESNRMTQKLVQGNATIPSSQISSSNSFLHEKQKDGMLQKEKNVHNLSFLRKTDENPQNTEATSGTSDGWPSTINISNHFQNSKALRPSLPVDTSPMEMMRSSYLPAPYSFSGNPENIGDCTLPCKSKLTKQPQIPISGGEYPDGEERLNGVPTPVVKELPNPS